MGYPLYAPLDCQLDGSVYLCYMFSGSTLTGGFKKPRELTWLTGIVLAVITVSFGVTGYRSNGLLGYPYRDRSSRRPPYRRPSVGDASSWRCIGRARYLEPVLYRPHTDLATFRNGRSASSLLTDPKARDQWTAVTLRRLDQKYEGHLTA
jgi:hypothetical protein